MTALPDRQHHPTGHQSHLTDRQRHLADAAIAVLGTRGLRQLTHRAVDAEAGVPPGSTSNYFRTREALIGAVLHRLTEIDEQAWSALAGSVRPIGREDLARLLAATLRDMAGPGRVYTLARYAIFVEAAFHPELQRRIEESFARIVGWASEWLRPLGSRDPAADCRRILSFVDGLLLHQLAHPADDFDPVPTILAVLPGPAADRDVDR
jgi:DNA-binding transcriptional regulator YbjK